MNTVKFGEELPEGWVRTNLENICKLYQQTKFQGIVKYFFHVQGYAHSKWYNQ